MSLESHDNGPEQSTQDKAREMQLRLEKGEPVQLYNAIQKLGDDPSFSGRIDFITRNKDFAEAFNKNTPQGMPKLSATKDAYGYKGTPEQNAVYLKTYLAMKAGGADLGTETREAKPAFPDNDPNAPKDSEEDLDDYLAFLPAKMDLTTQPISEVDLKRTLEPTPPKAQVVTALNPSEPLASSEATPITFTDLGPSVILTRAPLSEVLSSEVPNERAATLVKALGEESGDLRHLFESWPMAVAAASTTVQEGLEKQNLNPYDTLSNTVSASLLNGDVVLTLKDGKTVTTALLPDSAWNPVDIRNKAPSESERQRGLAQHTNPKDVKDVIDASTFRDDEEFQFDSDATSTASTKKPAEPGEKES